MARTERTAVPEAVAPCSRRYLGIRLHGHGLGNGSGRQEGDDEPLAFGDSALGHRHGKRDGVVAGLEGVAGREGGGGNHLDAGGDFSWCSVGSFHHG